MNAVTLAEAVRAIESSAGLALSPEELAAAEALAQAGRRSSGGKCLCLGAALPDCHAAAVTGLAALLVSGGGRVHIACVNPSQAVRSAFTLAPGFTRVGRATACLAVGTAWRHDPQMALAGGIDWPLPPAPSSELPVAGGTATKDNWQKYGSTFRIGGFVPCSLDEAMSADLVYGTVANLAFGMSAAASGAALLEGLGVILLESATVLEGMVVQPPCYRPDSGGGFWVDLSKGSYLSRYDGAVALI